MLNVAGIAFVIGFLFLAVITGIAERIICTLAMAHIRSYGATAKTYTVTKR